MDTQTIINLFAACIGLLVGWILKILHESLRDLQQADIDLTAKVQKIEVLVAGEYVKHSDLDKLSDAIFKKLDRIEAKLDGKADR